MVGAGGDALVSQGFGEAFGLGAAQAVDDGAGLVVALDGGGNLVGGAVARGDAVGEVGAVEVADEDLGVAQVELAGDVLADAGCCGGGERLEGDAGEDVAEFAESAVLGAEVVAPLADAVGLVDGDGGESVGVVGGAGEAGEEAGGEDALGGGEDEAQLAGCDAVEGVVGVVAFGGGVECGGGVAVEREAVGLVLHQGDERADDEGQPIGGERWGLVAE